LTDYINAGGWRNLYQTVTENPDHWSGDTAHLFGGVAGSWFLNNWMPYLTQSFETPEIWTPAIAEKFQQKEKDGVPGARLRPSWQSEYDGIPALDEYLGSQQPWRNK